MRTRDVFDRTYEIWEEMQTRSKRITPSGYDNFSLSRECPFDESILRKAGIARTRFAMMLSILGFTGVHFLAAKHYKRAIIRFCLAAFCVVSLLLTLSNDDILKNTYPTILFIASSLGLFFLAISALEEGVFLFILLYHDWIRSGSATFRVLRVIFICLAIAAALLCSELF